VLYSMKLGSESSQSCCCMSLFIRRCFLDCWIWYVTPCNTVYHGLSAVVGGGEPMTKYCNFSQRSAECVLLFLFGEKTCARLRHCHANLIGLCTAYALSQWLVE
jgi:hypothetical protein